MTLSATLFGQEKVLIKKEQSWFFYGFLGQFIIMIPEKKMVIVKTGLYNKLEVDQKKRPLQVQILIDELTSMY
ncbi:hypothetical protein [Chryseobacterium indoltheticum]|uniref:hypothetical protein n=1 Tax=Chryseobacterium indoltheticum TaxID=254 RepID=UPI003F495C0E